MIRISVILRYSLDQEVRTWLYVTSYEWGYGEPSFIDRLSTILGNVVEEIREKGYPVDICKPSLSEVLRGSLDRKKYLDPICLDAAYLVVDRVYRRISRDP